MSYEKYNANALPFDKMMPGMLELEMSEDTARIVNETIKRKVRVNLIINHRIGANAPPDRPKDH